MTKSSVKTILAFETSGPVLSVALGTGDGKIYEARSKSAFQHSENLIPLVERLFRVTSLRAPKGRSNLWPRHCEAAFQTWPKPACRQAGQSTSWEIACPSGRRASSSRPSGGTPRKDGVRSLEDIDAFAIDRGPGSFTGLRIGFSLLKGFLAVRKRPCYGALSLDMIAAKIDLPESSRLGIGVDARREKIYTRFYERKKGEWVAERKLELLSIPELKARIRKGTVLAGDALLRYPELEEVGARLQDIFPSARTLVRWFQSSDPRLTRLSAPRDFLPLYFRPSEAEEKRQTARRG